MTGPGFLLDHEAVYVGSNRRDSHSVRWTFFHFLIQTQDSSIFYDVMLDQMFVNENLSRIVFSSLVRLFYAR